MTEPWSQTGQPLQDHWVKEVTRKLLLKKMLHSVRTWTQQSLPVGPFGWLHQPAVSWRLSQVDRFAASCGFSMCNSSDRHASGLKDPCGVPGVTSLSLHIPAVAGCISLQLTFKLRTSVDSVFLFIYFSCLLVCQGVHTSAKNAVHLKIATGGCRWHRCIFKKISMQKQLIYTYIHTHLHPYIHTQRLTHIYIVY